MKRIFESFKESLVNEQDKSVKDLMKTFNPYVKDFYHDRNMDGLTKTIYLEDANIEIYVTLRYKNEDDEIYDTTLAIVLPDESGAMLMGEKNILKFLKDGMLKKMISMDHKDLDNMINKYKFLTF